MKRIDEFQIYPDGVYQLYEDVFPDKHEAKSTVTRLKERGINARSEKRIHMGYPVWLVWIHDDYTNLYYEKFVKKYPKSKILKHKSAKKH